MSPSETAFTFERGDHAELAETLERVHEHLVYSEGSFWTFSARGVWVRDGVRECLMKEILAMAGTPVGTTGKALRINHNDVRGVLAILELKRTAADFFASARTGIACRSGFVTIEKGGEVRVEPLTPEHRARHCVDAEYLETEGAETVVGFMRELFAGDEDQAQKIECILQFFGAARFGLAVKQQKCLVLEGAGANGKSTLLDVLSSVFPPEARAAVSPTVWSERFSRAGLVGILLNVVSELPANKTIDADAFKQIVTGDVVQGERKHENSFPFRPIAGHVFACNELPPTRDQSHGFWRRFIVIPFSRRFDEASADRELAGRLTEKHRAEILTAIVAGAASLVQADRYTVPTSHATAIDQWRKDADSVRSYLEENPPTSGATSSDVYAFYKAWCVKQGLREVSHTTFGKRTKHLKKKDASGNQVFV